MTLAARSLVMAGNLSAAAKLLEGAAMAQLGWEYFEPERRVVFFSPSALADGEAAEGPSIGVHLGNGPPSSRGRRHPSRTLQIDVRRRHVFFFKARARCPNWHYPVRQCWGAVLLKAGRAAAAEAVFRADLQQYMRNGWSLLGLVQVGHNCTGHDYIGHSYIGWV